MASPSLAQETSKPDGTAKPVAEKKKKNDDPNRVTCRRIGVTGSILGAKPECHTKAEWDKISHTTTDNWANRNAVH